MPLQSQFLSFFFILQQDRRHKLHPVTTFHFSSFQVAICPEHANLTPREKAIVNFALDVGAMKPITDAHLEALEPHGLDREDAWDIGAITAFFAMSNRYANFTRMLPNEEFYAMGRVPRQKKK